MHAAFENNASLESVNVRIVFKTTKIAVLTLKYNENEVISDTFALHAELEKNTSLESVNARVAVRRQGEGDKGTMKIADFATLVSNEVNAMLSQY